MVTHLRTSFLRRRREELRARHSSLFGTGLLALCLSVSLLSTGCRTRSFMSTQQEINLGQEGARQVEQEYRVIDSGPQVQRVQRIGRSLLDHMSDRRDVPYSFGVVEAKGANAFALPGGPIYVTTGLLDLLGSDDAALAGVLGHELGHINARHAARQMSSQLATNVLLDLALQNPSNRQLAGVGTQIVSLKYSREDEYDSDRRGLGYTYHAGYDPRGLISFFQKLQQQSQSGGPPEWLSTHPVTSGRIDRAQMQIANKNFSFGKK